MMRHSYFRISIFFGMILFCINGCALLKPHITIERATITRTSAIHEDLISLPKPKDKIIIAVYKFRDQTGQYKTAQAATTFSTAVTQGTTSMLNKALEDSGWFIPLEREGLNNLLNERKIIRSTRAQYQATDGEQQSSNLPPMLFAGVLLEGGIISYDTNIITGGAGLRYYGAGGFGKVQKDQVTVYLRLVSVKSGEILKTVSTTKSVLSREVDFGVYRFVRESRLLELETGFTTNEPPSMCVLEAIEKAVFDLIIECVQDNILQLADANDINSPVIQKYLLEKTDTGPENLIKDNSEQEISEDQEMQKKKSPEKQKNDTKVKAVYSPNLPYAH